MSSDNKKYIAPSTYIYDSNNLTYHHTYIKDNKDISQQHKILEIFNRKYYLNTFENQKCEKCGKKKHINPECGKSLFIYEDDLD